VSAAKPGSPADQELPPTIHSERTVWQGFRRLDLFDAEATVSPARPPARLDYEVMRVGRIVAVLPYDPALDAVLLLRQFRMGAHLANGRGLNIEVIAGRVEGDEDLADAARREAMEEGGVTLDALDAVLDFQPAPSALDESARLYVARADLSRVPAVTGLADEQEVILPFLVSPAEAMAAARAGRIQNGYTLLALTWFTLHRDEIVSRWTLAP
jgi:ADP-ribose pyrophosphatase